MNVKEPWKTIVDILLIIAGVILFPLVVAWIIFRLRNNKPINPFGPTPEEIAHKHTYDAATGTYTTSTTQNTTDAAKKAEDIQNATPDQIEKEFNSAFDPSSSKEGSSK